MIDCELISANTSVLAAMFQMREALKDKIPLLYDDLYHWATTNNCKCPYRLAAQIIHIARNTDWYY